MTRMNLITPAAAVLLAAACLAGLTGCNKAQATDALVATVGGNEPEHQLDFWHQLHDQTIVGNDDAFHAVLLFFDNKDDSADYAARVASLKQRGWLPEGWDEPAMEGIDRGTMAVILVNALQIKGGVTMRVFGPHPRYATRSLQYQGIYPASAPSQMFSGRQLMAIMGRVEDYQRYHPGTQPPTPSASPIKETAAR